MMLEERSAGVVIFRKDNGKILYLILHYPSGHWDFAKGKMENNEEKLQTAKREVREETGIDDLRFIEPFEEEIEYNFHFEGKPIHKFVNFFLAETFTSNISISHEHLDFDWLEYDKALSKVTYENAKRILRKANELISGHH